VSAAATSMGALAERRPAPVRILLADDHPVVRIGLANLLKSRPGYVLAGEAADARQTLDLVRRLKPDVLLLDLAMPDLSAGIDVLRRLTSAHRSLRVVVVSAYTGRDQVHQVLQMGARGIVAKVSAAREVLDAIDAVLHDRYWLGGQVAGSLADILRTAGPEPERPAPRRRFRLTARELEIVGAVLEGGTNRDIAQQFSISEETVKRHLTNIFDKTGVSTRLELALFAIHHQLVPKR